MSQPIIDVDALSKRYLVGHRLVSSERYTALRDVIARTAKSYLRKTRDLLSGRQIVEGDEVKEFWALKGVSFEVQQGEVVGIIGRNGAGKSTLLKILSRITEPTEGRAILRGRVASLLEVGTGFHPELTGRENVYLNGAILGMRRAEVKRKFDEIVEFAEVEQFLDAPVKRYSSGMYVRLAFSVAAHLEPEILIVDEVLAVGDGQFQKKCLGKMEDIAQCGRTVLFVSHNMAAVAAMCEKAVLLKDGRVADIGSATQVVEDYQAALHHASQTNGARHTFFSEVHEIGIADCSASFEANSEAEFDLTLRLDIIAKKPYSNVGVGFKIMTLDGVLVSSIAPMMTNYVVDSADGIVNCEIRCPSVTKYLAGGDYTVVFWLSRPRIETLLVAEDALRLSVPLTDPYKSGMYFEKNRHGIVPLPTTFEINGKFTEPLAAS